MALRLFLMGVVASLALDLPNGGLTKTTQSSRAWLETKTAAHFPDAGRRFAALVEVSPPKVQEETTTKRPEPVPLPMEPTVAESPVSPPTQVPTISPIVAIETAPIVAIPSTILPGRAEAAVLLAMELESSLATDLLPTPIPMAVPMPAPEIAEMVASPTAGAAIAPEVPITLATTDPMSPPPTEDVAVTTPTPASAPISIPVPPIAVTEAPKPVDPDAAFAKVVNEMASSFASDTPAVPTIEPKPLLARGGTPPPPAAPAEEVAIQNEEPGEDLYPGLAYALNRASEGLPTMPSEPTIVQGEASATPKPAPIVEPSPETSRSERLAQAVRLTGQAMNAWASLLSQRPAVTSIRR